jgi:LacI family transcriptional regulator
MASLSDVARHARVSKSTVSLVLNNKPNVSLRMKEKVMRAIAELDPHFFNGKHSAAKRPSILLIHPMSMSSHQVFRELLQGVKAAVVEEAHGNLSLAVHDPPLQPDHATSALIHDPLLRPDGVIIMAASSNDPIFREIEEEKLPCVLLARQLGPQGISVVGMDNSAGATLAVDYLLARGHKDIVFAGGNMSYEYTELRLKGYMEKIEEAHLVPRVYLGSGDAAVTAMLEDVKGHGQLPTAILFVNDEHAVHGLEKLREAGIKVPADISAIGFDDSDNATRCEPPLTSVRVPRFLIGKLAGRMVTDLIRTPDLDHATIVLKTSLTVRDSVRQIS